MKTSTCLFFIMAFILAPTAHAEIVDLTRSIYPSLTSHQESIEVSEEGHTVYKKTVGGLTCTQNEKAQNTCEFDLIQKNAKLIYDSLSAPEYMAEINPETGYIKTIKQVGDLLCFQEAWTLTYEFYVADCYFANY